MEFRSTAADRRGATERTRDAGLGESTARSSERPARRPAYVATLRDSARHARARAAAGRPKAGRLYVAAVRAAEAHRAAFRRRGGRGAAQPRDRVPQPDPIAAVGMARGDAIAS